MDSGMRAPHSEMLHCMPAAGIKSTLDHDIFRFNRVTPYYPTDPCIRPNEGDLICTPTMSTKVNCPELLPPAGVPNKGDSDRFMFYRSQSPITHKPSPHAHSQNCPCGKYFNVCPQRPADDIKCPPSNRSLHRHKMETLKKQIIYHKNNVYI